MTVYQPSIKPTYRSLARAALTWGDVLRPAATQYPYTYYMNLLSRDREILALVSRFRQLSAGQIRALVFPTQTTLNPSHRALTRLVNLDLLDRVNQRLPGGARGGSQMYVYQLGKKGWPMFNSGRRRFNTVVDFHTLAIADVFVSLKQAEYDKHVRIINYATEPDSHLLLAGADIRPDLYIDVAVRATELRRTIWLEIDMGTERQKQVLEQVATYKHAYDNRALYPLPQYPTVLFLAVNDERAREIRYWIQRAKDLPDIFTVATIAEFPTILQRT